VLEESEMGDVLTGIVMTGLVLLTLGLAALCERLREV
jgi:hypothetical protein